jgi:histidine triad (HIT) family protein
MSDCLFCKIVKGEIPAQVVYSDDHSVVFKDISPKAPVHLLAIPREHYAGIHEIDSQKMEILAHLMNAVSSIVNKEKLAEKGYRLVVNCGKDAGQVVPHVHVHILSGRSMGSLG